MRQYYADFKGFVATLKLRHFSYGELLARHDAVRRGAQNGPPPRDLWPNIEKTIKVVDELRAQCGFPIRITSAYRSPAYNRAVGGAAKSQHKRFTALDIQPVSGSRKELLIMWKTLTAMRQNGLFKGGLGRYATFIHIDTRGYNATW